MKSKICPKCNTVSYSAGAKPWICPKCGKDISEVEVNKRCGYGMKN